MRSRFIHAVAAFLISTFSSIIAAESDTASPSPPSTNWIVLFNGTDFSGWDKLIASNDDPINPNRDPDNIFSVHSDEDGTAIRVLGKSYGAITTQEEFENVHISLEFKWGVQRWAPRAKVGRDSGILYACIGQPNPRTGWMTSIENNIMEKGIGQWWSVNGAIIDAEGEWITPEMELYIPYKKEGPAERNIVYRPGAPLITATPANGITPPFDTESVFGNWNTVEVIFWGGNCIHRLNGAVNLVAVNPRYEKDGAWLPLERGKIQLQSEGAELFYRNIRARHLRQLPQEYYDLVPSPVGNDHGFHDLLSPEAARKWKQAGPGGFKLENGVAAGEGGMGLWWYSGQTFTNFVLRGEFQQESSTADSGVFLRFPDPANDPWVAVKKGHEMEIGDDQADNPTWHTGAIYPFQAPLPGKTKPAGEWNSYEIVCRGQNYSVRLNGKLVTTWTDHARRATSGYIGLQNYDGQATVRHRNLRIKELW
jgi:hypothetical protein